MRPAPLLALVATLALAPRVTAQTPPGMPAMPGMAQVGGLMEMARLQMNPAAAVLARRDDLGLTPAQVAALDSVARPLNGIIDEMMRPQASPAQIAMAQGMADPTAPLDEVAMRAALREQSDRQIDLTIETLKAQRRMMLILTEEQRSRWMGMQMEAAMRMMEAMGGTASPDP